MGLRIHTNVTSLSVQRYLSRNTEDVQLRTARLASGQRMAKAGDDAGAQGVATRMSARARSSEVAQRGIEDGLSMLRVADGILERTAEILTRNRELALQSANGLIRDRDRIPLEEERVQLAREASRLIDEAEYNGLALFPEDDPIINVRVGIDNEESDWIQVELDQVERIPLTLGGISIGTIADANTSLATVDELIDFLSSRRGDIGAAMNRLESALSTLDTKGENLSSSRSRIQDADMAIETAALLRSQLLQEGGSSVLVQANSSPSIALQLLAP